MLKYLEATEHEKRSSDRDAWIAKNLKPAFTGRVLSDLGAEDVRAYISKRRNDGTKNSTIHRELSLLSSAINHARLEWAWDIPNPVTGRKPGQGQGRIRWLMRAEANNLMTVAARNPWAPHLFDFIRLGLNTGCRSQEMLGLEWDRVDLKNRLIYLEPMHVKKIDAPRCRSTKGPIRRCSVVRDSGRSIARIVRGFSVTKMGNASSPSKHRSPRPANPPLSEYLSLLLLSSSTRWGRKRAKQS